MRPGPRPRLTRSCRRILAALAAGLTVLAPPAAAQREPGGDLVPAEPAATGPLRLERVSPWVEPDGTWTARFEVVGPAPLDATIVVSIRRALTGELDEVRQDLADLREGGELPAALQSDLRLPIGPLLSPGALTVTVPIRDRAGDADRLLIPNPGVHPVALRLETTDGTVLQEERLFLNRLPAGQATDAPLQVGLLLDVSSPATVGAGSRRVLPEEGATESRRALDLLRGAPEVPVTVGIDPHLLVAIAELDPTLAGELTGELARQEVVRQGWTDVDLEAWSTTGRDDDLNRTLLAGQATLTGQLGTEPNARLWGEDPTVGPRAVRRLTGAGIDRLVVTPAQLDTGAATADDLPTLGIIGIEGPGRPVEAVLVDPVLQFLLIDPDAVPAEAAHQVISELQAIWFAAPTDAVPATALAIDDRVPTTTARALLTGVAGGPVPTLEVTRLDALFDEGSPIDEVDPDQPAALPLRPTSPPDVTAESAFLAELRPRDRAHELTMGEVEGLVPVGELLLAAQDRSLGNADQRARLDAAATRISDDFAAVRAPPTRNVTVTSRRATLPLQLANELERPATVELRFSGPRLEIEGGRRRVLELQPGINQVEVPVTARTSGEFFIGVELRTADGAYLLDRSSLRVRSTAFSGVGLLLGGGALVVLAVWWFRSWRRARGRTPDDTPPSVA